MMEKRMTGKFCNAQLGFVILLSFVFCLVSLSFDYSALTLTGTSNGDPLSSVNNYENNPIITQNPKISRKSGSDESISPLPQNPLIVFENKSDSDSCLGRYIYMHDIPSRFNEDLLKNCSLLTRGTEKNMCPYLANFAFGPQIENREMVLTNKSWYKTNQFLLEVIFHHKMKYYKCLTNDSSLASAIYVPFYAGLDIGRSLWNVNISVRDSSAIDLLKWLSEKNEWKTMWGRNHFLVVGRISWDFRRQTDNESDWGSKLRFLPESRNMSMLSIEASSWNNDYAIPYPTCFHPSRESEILEWQNKMRRQYRPYLFSFAGAPRPEYRDSIRGKIIDECLASGSGCKLLDCNYGATNCDNPVNVMRVFQSSVFCLQPPGDSYTRRSIFDSILAGCIPVFFHPGTAYAQYLWHLPKNFTTYSLYIPVRDIKDWKLRLNETLLGVAADRVTALREEVIKLIPRVIYTYPKSKLETIEEDAFDIAVKGILERIQRVRDLIQEEKDLSDGFADGDDYKYTFSPYGEGILRN